METRIYCYIIFNFIVIFPYLNAKPITQNGLSGRENKSGLGQRNSLLPSDNIVGIKKLSSSQFKKAFHIKSPLKPKKIKYSPRPRSKRKNQTTKKDYYHYETINQNYLPILKNLGLLFNNILGSDTSHDDDNSDEYNSPYKYERDVCECAHKRNSDSETSNSEKKAVTAARPFSTDKAISTTTTPPAYNFTDNNFGNFRRHKNISLLLPRNTTSFRRNNYRFSQRSGSTHYGSIERNVTRNLRNHERDTGDGEFESYTENNDENTNSNTRDSASGNRSNEIQRRRTRLQKLSRGTSSIEKPILSPNKTSRGLKRKVFKHKGKNEFKVTRNQTNYRELLSEHSPGLRRLKPNRKANSRKTTESNEEKVTEILFKETNSKRLTDRSGQTTTQTQEISRTTEAIVTTVIPIEIFTNTWDEKQENFEATRNKTKILSPISIETREFMPNKKTKLLKTNKYTNSEETIKISFNTTKIKRRPDDVKGFTTKNQEIHTANEVLSTTMTTPVPVEKIIMIYDGKKGNHNLKSTKNKTITPGLSITPRREFEPHENEKSDITSESDEEIFEITFNTTNVMHLPERNRQTTTENQEIHSDPLTTSMSISTPAEKFVMIYDGYSVARDVNGKNIRAEK